MRNENDKLKVWMKFFDSVSENDIKKNKQQENVNNENLTREEAYKKMEQGYKVTHRFFDNDEYLYIKDGKMYSEEGYKFDEGWEMRKGGNWEEGWDIWNG